MDTCKTLKLQRSFSRAPTKAPAHKRQCSHRRPDHRGDVHETAAGVHLSRLKSVQQVQRPTITRTCYTPLLVSFCQSDCPERDERRSNEMGWMLPMVLVRSSPILCPSSRLGGVVMIGRKTLDWARARLHGCRAAPEGCFF